MLNKPMVATLPYAYQYALNNTPTECNRERLILALGSDDDMIMKL